MNPPFFITLAPSDTDLPATPTPGETVPLLAETTHVPQYNHGFPDAERKHKPLPDKPRQFYDPKVKRVCAACGERVYAHWSQCLCGCPVDHDIS